MAGDLFSKTDSAIRRGLEWLNASSAEIAEIKDFAAHYKAPYLYAVTGMRERARQYSDLMAGTFLQEDGDFRMSSSQKGWLHLPATPANRYIYGNGWTVVGLQKIGSYGAARRGLEFLKRFQDPQLGGFYSRFGLEHREADPRYLDTSSTCSAALAMLACGEFDRALRAGDFMLRMIEAQPQRERFFFTTWEAGKGLLTDVFHDEEATAIRGRKHFCVSTEKNALYEMVWFLGLPMKLLGKLYELSGRSTYLEAAAKLFHFFNRMSPERWQNNSGTKIMWGASELYRHTGEETYKEAAVKILEWLVESQHDSGVWVHSLWYKSIQEQPFQATLDLVQEYVSEFSDVLYDLAHGS